MGRNMINISFKKFLKEMVALGWSPDELDLRVGVDTICPDVTEITVESMTNTSHERVRIERTDEEAWNPDNLLVTYILNLPKVSNNNRTWSYKQSNRFFRDSDGWSTDANGNPPPKIVKDAVHSLGL